MHIFSFIPLRAAIIASSGETQVYALCKGKPDIKDRFYQVLPLTSYFGNGAIPEGGMPVCRQDMKEVRFRPVTEEHDYHVRLKNAKKFISKVRNIL